MTHSASEFLFTSESVTEGHPDKVADQISDGVLDAVLRQDPGGRVACETLVNTGLVVVSGEISTSASLDIQAIARQTIAAIGYTDATLGTIGFFNEAHRVTMQRATVGFSYKFETPAAAPVVARY